MWAWLRPSARHREPLDRARLVRGADLEDVLDLFKDLRPFLSTAAFLEPGEIDRLAAAFASAPNVPALLKRCPWTADPKSCAVVVLGTLETGICMRCQRARLDLIATTTSSPVSTASRGSPSAMPGRRYQEPRRGHHGQLNALHLPPTMFPLRACCRTAACGRALARSVHSLVDAASLIASSGWIARRRERAGGLDQGCVKTTQHPARMRQDDAAPGAAKRSTWPASASRGGHSPQVLGWHMCAR